VKHSYVLKAYIAAHETAQVQVPKYLGDTEGIDTAEEVRILEESQAVVLLAKKRLHEIDKGYCSVIHDFLLFL
jgi:hypothetical protein